MSNARLMKPLFYNGYYNCDGKKMRAVLVREISNGADTYRLWRSDGKPDIEYPRAENDTHLLYVEIRDYLVPLRVTDFYLIDHCGYHAAVELLYGDENQRCKRFNTLQKSGDEALAEAIALEREKILLLGSDPVRQTNYIKAMLDNNVARYVACKESGGDSFPDYVGALILDEIDMCISLAFVHRQKISAEKQARKAKAEAEDKAFCEEKNRSAEQVVQKAIHIIKDGGILQNQTVKFYHSRYSWSEFSIINYLMRKYGVSVPLRTQGWINGKLTSVTIGNGKCEHLRYLRSKGAQCSQRFFNCMGELLHNVNAEKEA